PFLAGILLAALLLLILSFRYIPNNRIGVVEKLFSLKGSVKSGLIALDGEAGFQPHVLRGGWHFLFCLQYKIHIMPLVTIPQGKIGYVFARDGVSLPATQALASNMKARDFQDVNDFLMQDGQKGPQRMILREGTYAINLAQFVVLSEDRPYYLVLDPDELAMFERMASIITERQGFTPIIIKDADDMVGIVTIHDGESLPPGEIIAPTVGKEPLDEATYHNNFQDPDKFLTAGGRRGRQLQVLVEGTYYINRLFATVERISKTTVDVGNVGVVVSYTGDAGEDLSGKDYNHGEMVQKGYRGVWSEALLPGKYAFNTYAGKIMMVPTTNIILKWIRNQAGTHRLDENLSEINLITKDAFEPTLPLSVVVHIDYRKAPLVIQRFGDVKRLVEQTLDPMVAAYFKNIGQSRTLIQLIQERSLIQQQASLEMKERFAHYNLELEEVLIGTPGSMEGDKQIEIILNQLRSRQVAEEQVETYNRQEKAAVKERELREAESRAKQQSFLTESEIGIAVQSNQGKADLARAEQQALQIRTLSEAEAAKIRIVAEGEAQKIKSIADADAERAARVGIAQAMAIEEQVGAYGGPQFQLIQQVMERFAQAVQEAKVDVVPKILMTTGGNGQEGVNGSGNLLESLLGVMLSEKLSGMLPSVPVGARSGESSAIRQELKKRIETNEANEAKQAAEPPTSA
ncbi:MAG TPA: SPFH domain-containing protein, partial [Coleofasciculaceae cyanobacterium]